MNRPTLDSPSDTDSSASSSARDTERARTARLVVGWCGALLAIALVGGFALSMMTKVGDTVSAPVHAVAEGVAKVAAAAAPRVDIRTLNASAIADFRKEDKIVPFSATIDARSTITSSKKVLGVNLGDTRVDIRVPDCRVQYYLPLAAIRESDFSFDDATRTWKVSVPAPLLDESLVSIPSDPTKWEIRRDIGWARLDAKSGDWCEHSARASIRPTVIREANNRLLLDEARREGERLVGDLLRAVLARHGVRDIGVQVAAH